MQSCMVGAVRGSNIMDMAFPFPLGQEKPVASIHYPDNMHRDPKCIYQLCESDRVQ